MTPTSFIRLAPEGSMRPDVVSFSVPVCYERKAVLHPRNGRVVKPGAHSIAEGVLAGLFPNAHRRAVRTHTENPDEDRVWHTVVVEFYADEFPKTHALTQGHRSYRGGPSFPPMFLIFRVDGDADLLELVEDLHDDVEIARLYEKETT